MPKRFTLLTLLALFILPAHGQSMGDKQFPIMAWDYVDNPAILQSMHEAGINAVAFVRPNMLDACQKFALKCIVFDESLAGEMQSKPFNGDLFRQNLPAFIKKIGNKPAFYGIHLKDEPPASDYPELAKAVAAVKEYAPGKWPYINLLPGVGAPYQKYVDEFVRIVSPTALSYDRYSIIGDVGSAELDPLFWTNLAQMRQIALEHHLPFWNIVLTAAHWRYRDLTPADIRLQVWGSLVYGVSGISYYKFISKELPIHGAPDLGNWRDSPLNQFEEKTPTWDWIRDMDREVQNIAPVFLKLHSDDVYHIGDVPDGNHGPTATSLVKAMPDGDFVIGDFTHEDGRRFVLIMNKSLKRSARCDPQFQAAPRDVRYVSARTGEIKPFPSRVYWLAPGQGVLLEVSYK